MDYINLMLTGKIEMSEFIKQLQTNSDLQQEIHDLIPPDAVFDMNHPIWECASYKAFVKSDFDMMKHLKRLFHFDGTIADNLNIFGSLKAVYRYEHPDTPFTTQYHDAFDLYLDVVKDCSDGPEVGHLVERIIVDALKFKTKKQRLTYAKAEVQELFQCEGSKRPRWIQGPEWPMGEDSPMVFISQKRHGESVEYIFKDSKTKQERIIVQYH